MAITYKLRPEYSTYGGGTISYGKYGNSFNVGAALTAGSGSIIVTDLELAVSLDRYAPLFRFADDGLPLTAFDARFRTLSLGGQVLTTDIVEQIQLNNEAFPRLIVKGDGTILTGNGTVSPTTPISGGSAHTIADEGGALTQRGTLNFIGAGVTAADNSGAGRTDVTIPGGGGSSITIQDEGSALTQRATVNFIGAGVTAVDNAGSTRTDVTIPSGSSGYATVQDEGGALTQRGTLNFIGTGVTAVDNAGSTRTDVTITGGAAATLPWINAADYGFAQGASAATIKTSLVNAIAALPAAGGTIVIPDADVTIDISASAVAIGTKNVRLVGGTNTRIKSSNEGTTAGLTMFSLASTGGTLTAEKLRLEGPDLIGTAGSCDLIAVGGASASGRITAYDCDFAKFTFALRCSSSVNWIGWIEAFNCTFTGYGSSTASMASTGILVGSISTGATGRGVRVRDCEFRSYGLGASNLFHGMYINTDWDVEVDGCHFISSVGTGYGVQIYDSVGTNTASTHQKVSRCHFYAALTSKGVVIANKAKAVVQHCTFDNTTSCVLWANAVGSFGGGGEVLDCVFTGVNASGTATLDQTGATSGDQGVRVARNRFTGSAAALISCGPGYWTIEDNEFTPSASVTTCIDASLALTRLTLSGNRFRGAATQWVWIEAGGTLVVEENYFWQTSGIAIRNSSTSTVQRIIANDFSQVAGASVTNSAAPTTYFAQGNYGSVGLADVGGSGATLPTGTSGASQVLKHKKDNTVVWVGDTHIDMSAYGLPTDGTTDATPSFATMRAAEPSGGVVRIPRGTYRLLTDLDLTYGQYDLMGEGKYNTTLWASNDTITGTNAQTGGTTAVTLKADAWGEKFSLVGPLTMDKNNTASAPKRSGINLRDRCWLRDVRVEAFNNGIQIDGNHQTIYNCVVANCLYNMCWAQNSCGYTVNQGPSFTHGNQTMIDVDLTGAGFASMMIDGNSKIDSSTFQQVHMGFCQRGIDAFAKGSQQIAIGNSSFYDCSFESVGDCYINDLGWNTANRRLMAYVQFHNQLTGGHDTAYSNIGGGLEMIKFGIVQDVRIHGRVGDGSNTSFGSVAWGTTSTACGFRFEQVTGFYHSYADTLFNASIAQAKPMFRWEGGLLGWSDVYFTVFDNGYLCSVLKNGSGGTLTAEKIVSGVVANDPTGTSGVKHYDATGAAIGRLVNSPNAAGLMVPVVFQGRFNGPSTVDATVVAGTSLTPVTGGGVRKAAAGEQIIGTSFTAPSGGTISTSIQGPWVGGVGS